MRTMPDLALLRRDEARSPGNDPTTIPAPPRRLLTRRLLPALLLLLSLLLAGLIGRPLLFPPLPVETLPVLVRAAQAEAVAAFQAPGWVEADPHALVVPALAPGVVREVLALEGQRVEAGAVVARLVDDDARLALARLEGDLARASAEVALARAALVAAKEHWENPVALSRDAAVAREKRAEAEAALPLLEAEIRAAHARREELQEKYDRERRLAGRDALPAFTATRASLELAAWRETCAALEARRPLAEAALRREHAELLAAEEAFSLRIEDRRALDAASAMLERAIAERDALAAARDEAALALARMTVVSPAAGIVMRRLVRPGDRLMAGNEMTGMSILVLYEPAHLQVRVDVPLADAARLREGMTAEIVVDVLPDTRFAGRVTRIVPEADIQKNTLQAKVAFLATDAAVRPEMLARVRFLADAGAAPGAGAPRVFAPEKLLLADPGGGSAVWLLEVPGERARRRPVTPGPARGDGWVEIASGLSAGDRLITTGRERLADGARVAVKGEDAAWR